MHLLNLLATNVHLLLPPIHSLGLNFIASIEQVFFQRQVFGNAQVTRKVLKVIARQTTVIVIVVFHCRVWSHWCGVHNQWPYFHPNQQVCIGELYHCWWWCAGVWWASHCRVWFWPWDYKWRVECRKGRTQHRRHPDRRWWLWVVPKRVGAIVLVCIYTIIQIRYCLLFILFLFSCWGKLQWR